MFLNLILPFCLSAQQQTEYNQKGDEAMKKKDYRDAKMWYEEGVSKCDSYSINQLTTIWLESERMRPSMRSLMNKCLNCLTVQATENDLNAITNIIVYYAKGIGTPKNKELELYWTEYKRELLKSTNLKQSASASTNSTPNNHMTFFIGYSYSIESPYGITFGGVKQRFGWYVRFKTNMSFMNYAHECNNKGEVIGFTHSKDESYAVNTTRKDKKNAYAGTLGLVIKCCPWLYASVGIGYGKRALLHPFITHSYSNFEKTREFWCYNLDSSYKGVATEIDAKIKLNRLFYVDIGCNTINFKYIDLNAGLGVFF